MVLSKEKWDSLQKRLNKCAIQEEELIEKFILGSGKGGQKINKTSSCVYIKHLPTGIEVKCQKGRSRELNRYYARQELCKKIEETLFQQKSEKQQESEKIRRQKKRRTRKQKEKMLEQKKLRGGLKRNRKPPSE